MPKDENDNVIKFPVKKDDEKIPPDSVLSAAIGNLDQVVVIGYTKNEDFYYNSSEPGGEAALWLLERAKHKLMRISDDMEEG